MSEEVRVALERSFIYYMYSDWICGPYGRFLVLYESRIITYTKLPEITPSFELDSALSLTISILIKTMGLRCKQHKQGASFGY